MTPLELRDKVIEARRLWGQGQLTTDELNATADKYIDALKAYKKKTGKKLSIPNRAYLLRAL